MGELQRGGVPVWGEFRCGEVALCGSCGVWELRCGGVAVCGSCIVCGSCNVWELQWTSCSEKKIVKVSSVRDALCGSFGL